MEIIKMLTQMSPLQRFVASAHREIPDQVPFMPFITGHYVSWFAGLKEGDYWPALKQKLDAYLAVQERWPNLILYPGIYIDLSVAVEPSALGAKIYFPENASPQVEPFFSNPEEIMALEPADPYKDGLMPKALETHRYMLDHCPKKWIDEYGYLAGSASSLGPTDVAGLSLGYDTLMRFIYKKPQLVHHLMEVATETIIRYLHAFEEIGGKFHRFQIADDSLAFFSPKHFIEFSLPYLQKIFKEFNSYAVGILHCDTNSTHLLDIISDVGMHVFNFGPEMDISLVKQKVGDKACIMGNIDPLHIVRKKTTEEVYDEAKRIIEIGKSGGGFIMTMGSGTARGTPSENIDAIYEAVKECGRYTIH
jgi:uroporphyrinogen decarboxylase